MLPFLAEAIQQTISLPLAGGFFAGLLLIAESIRFLAARLPNGKYTQAERLMAVEVTLSHLHKQQIELTKEVKTLAAQRP